MKVVTYNIRYGIGLDQRCDLGRIVEAIRGADIIALQEVERFWRRSGMVDQPQVIGDLLKGYYWAYFPAFDVDASIRKESGDVLNRRRQFGTMTLSRWPILSTRSLMLPQLATAYLIGMCTGALEAVIDTPFGLLRTYSLHLSAISPRERLMQIDALMDMHQMIGNCGAVLTGIGSGKSKNKHEAEHIEKMDWSNGEPPLPVPVNTMFMGDFNSTDDSSEYIGFIGESDPIYGRGMQTGSLVDSWSVARERIGEPISWWPDPPDRLPEHPLRLDYCLINTELAAKVARCWVDIDAIGSDHKPYWVEFEL